MSVVINGQSAVSASGPIMLSDKPVHFVGIGGCGMSGLARIVQGMGGICTGSDVIASTITRQLEIDGIPVSLEQTRETMPEECELVITSAAIKSDHPEVCEANTRSVPVLKYAQMIGRLINQKSGIAVAGTHGKSTVTAMLSHALLCARLDPSFLFGATCKQIGGGSRCGGGDQFVVEACEYDRSFLNLYPTQAVFLNIEADHLDVYDSLDAIVDAFADLAGRLPSASSGGYLLIDHQAPQIDRLVGHLKCDVETIGFAAGADWRVVIDPHNNQFVDLIHQGRVVCRWVNPLPGRHMAYNACAAAVMAHRCGADWNAIGQAMQSFQGIDRRVELLGRCTSHHSSGEVTVVDDYGHHPTEIRATLSGLRERYQPKRVICVFQPHQHSRTSSMLQEFAGSFSEADIVIVPDIYTARDNDTQRQSVGSNDLVQRISQQHPRAMYAGTFDNAVEQLKEDACGGDLVVTMGAGDVWKIAHRYLATSVDVG